MLEDRLYPLLRHLEALRRVFIICIGTVLTFSVGIWFFYNPFMALLSQPLTEDHYHLIFIGVTEAFITRLRLTVFTGLLLALPVIFWQVWGFVLPALKYKEKRFSIILVPFSVIFFFAGTLFAFYVILPLALKALLAMGGPTVAPMISMEKYVSFVTKLLLGCGLVFEIPVVIFILARAGVVTHAFLVHGRKYAILCSVIAGGALAPGPDVLSMLILTVPTYLLFELSVLIARFVRPAPRALSPRNEGTDADAGSLQ